MAPVVLCRAQSRLSDVSGLVPTRCFQAVASTARSPLTARDIARLYALRFTDPSAYAVRLLHALPNPPGVALCLLFIPPAIQPPPPHVGYQTAALGHAFESRLGVTVKGFSRQSFHITLRRLYPLGRAHEATGGCYRHRGRSISSEVPLLQASSRRCGLKSPRTGLRVWARSMIEKPISRVYLEGQVVLFAFVHFEVWFGFSGFRRCGAAT